MAGRFEVVSGGAAEEPRCHVQVHAGNGGRGTIPGALVGSLMMGMLSNGLILMGLSVSWQMIIKGLIVLAAVAVSLREPNR